MAELVVTEGGAVHRPRNVDWKRAAALLYGDWGTSKAYVLGLAFVAAGFSSLPLVLAVCALTALVAINYGVICAYFPEGGGVYSAAKSQGRLLAVVGALLLIADLTVTAALSGWSGLSYVISGAEDITWLKFLKDHIALTTIFVLMALGTINWYGPKHSGSLAVRGHMQGVYTGAAVDPDHIVAMQAEMVLFVQIDECSHTRSQRQDG